MTLSKPPWGDEPIFDWDDVNEYHISRHRVMVFDVEECFDNEYKVKPHQKSKSEPDKYGDRYAVLGSTNGGRKLIIIVQHVDGSLIRPITAWDILR